MEKPTQQTSKNEEPGTLDDLFMDLFTPEFLKSLPSEQIETVINKLEQAESSSETMSPEWLAVRNVLRERGYVVES